MDNSETLIETVTTGIISTRQLVCEGIPFEWCVVGENPSLVTVQNPVFGSLHEFSDGDFEAFAISLARKLLRQPALRAS